MPGRSDNRCQNFLIMESIYNQFWQIVVKVHADMAGM